MVLPVTHHHKSSSPATDTPLATTLLRDVIATADEIAGLERVLPRGAVHPGGPHYRLRGSVGPISIGEDECAVFAKVIERFRPAHCFIVGNAFGLSSVFIAKMMEANGGQTVVTLDAKCEGDGDRCFDTAARLREKMECSILTNKIGWSPQDIDAAADRDAYDLIFLDGLHRHPQVSKDFHGVKHLAGDETILCWHDYWMPGIPQSVAEAIAAGFKCIKINCSCEIVLGTRSNEVFEGIGKMFDNVETPQPRRRVLAFLRIFHAVAVGTIKKRFYH